MLQPVDSAITRELMTQLGGEELLHFVSVEYAEKADFAFSKLGVSKLTFLNVWDVFRSMLPLMLE